MRFSRQLKFPSPHPNLNTNCNCFNSSSFQVDQSHLIHYVPQASSGDDPDTKGLMSATLGLSFTVEPWHFEVQGTSPRRKTSLLAGDGSDQSVMDPMTFLSESSSRADYQAEAAGGGKELWVRCEATMPPIGGSVYPYIREVFLGSKVESFNSFQSISSSSTPSNNRVVIMTILVAAGVALVAADTQMH